MISYFEITDFLNFKVREEKWTGVTYNNCRIGLHNFFRYLKVNKYIPENPVNFLKETIRYHKQNQVIVMS